MRRHRAMKYSSISNGSALGDLVTLGADAVGYDFTAQIAESGTYWFVVRATGMLQPMVTARRR